MAEMNEMIRALLAIAIFAMCASLPKANSKPTANSKLCPVIDDPRYGEVRTTGYQYGDRAIYKCFDNFKLVGNSERRCQRSGSWTSSPPRCKPKYKPCPEVNNPRYGEVRTTGYLYRDGAIYKCAKAFKLVGNSERRCQRNGHWTGSPPICQPIRRKCPNLNNPRHGDVKVTGNQPGDKARFTCDKGFKLVGNSIRKCQSHGYWTEKNPVCKRKN